MAPEAEVLRSILESIGDGVVVADARGQVVVCNQAARRILGGDVVQSNPLEWPLRYGVFLPDSDTPFPAERQPLVRALRGETSERVQMFVRNSEVPDGIHTSVTGRPLRDG